MIVLDTNVISEQWKLAPDFMVLRWLDEQSIETLYLSAITLAELRYGIADMPAGKRKNRYQQRLDQDVLPLFAGRVLSFDAEISQVYADIMARAKAQGKAIGKEDGYIAATAAAYRFAIATRDTSPFIAAGLRVINPWASA